MAVYGVYWERMPRENTVLTLITEDKLIAEHEARELQTRCTTWESVKVVQAEIQDGQITDRVDVPFRVFITDNGAVIDEIKGQIIPEAVDIALKQIEAYEREDNCEDVYCITSKRGPHNYDVINEDGNSYIR